MRERHSNRPQSGIPLSDQDSEALDEIFAKVELEEMRHIEATVARYSVAPLEPWEETGWVINSSLPIGQESVG
jgi:hypothetical protein